MGDIALHWMNKEEKEQSKKSRKKVKKKRRKKKIFIQNKMKEILKWGMKPLFYSFNQTASQQRLYL